MRSKKWAVALAVMAGFAAPGAWAQGSAPAPAIDPASVTVPDLNFTESPGDVAGYEKYFYFVRADTDFATAYADIRECDGFARGLSYRIANSGFYGNRTLVDNLSDSLWGSGQRRELRRLNLRTCMFYKAYLRFGLPREIWKQFNFEEGNRSPGEAERQRCLMQQARIASGPMPSTRELGR